MGESPRCYGCTGVGAWGPRCLFIALSSCCTYEVSRSSIL